MVNILECGRVHKQWRHAPLPCGVWRCAYMPY